MSYRDQQRPTDVAAAITAIRAHLQRGELTDELVFDAVRVRPLEIGEAVKALSAEILAGEPAIPWGQIARMRDNLAHRYFETSHAIVQATVEHDLPALDKRHHPHAKPERHGALTCRGSCARCLPMSGRRHCAACHGCGCLLWSTTDPDFPR